MNKNEGLIDGALLAIGSVYSLANIEHILGIIILVIQLGWIITKLIVKFYNAIKSKENLATLDEDVLDTVEQLEIFKDALTIEEEKSENERNDNE